jgi:hypothetical protein
MDHRRIQRALFRMQLDPGFAERVRAREPDAIASAVLGAEELELLASADPAGVSADCDGKRRAQFLRNVTSEFGMSLAVARVPGLVERFTASREFHEAVSRDESLPLAFADYLTAAALARGVGALAALEREMARARRTPPLALTVGTGEIALAPCAALVRLPLGTFDAAARVRSALDRGEPVPERLDVRSPPFERILLRRTSQPAPFRLPDVEVEPLSPALGELLARAERPRPRAELAADADLAEVVADLVAQGILVEG